MTPSEYLLFSIKNKCYTELSWIISILAVTRETDAQKNTFYPGKLIAEPFGWYVIDGTGQRVKLETKQPTNLPLFSVKDKIVITPEWLPSVKEEKLETTVGVLLINAVCMADVFGARLPYKNGSFKPSDVESDILAKLESNPQPGEERSPDKYYVDELIKFQTNVGFLEPLSNFLSHSITRVGILPAPGRKEFKAEILKKYEGKLRDPVQMAAFENELRAFDEEYLKADPAYGKFMSGKKVKGSRMKLFMTQGGESNAFIGALDVVPIVPALEDGIPMDPEGFTATANAVRYGSFARGAETVNGGVVSKSLNRASDTWVIEEGDCGRKIGIRRLYRGKATRHLVGRYVLVNDKPILIETEEQAKAFDGQGIIVRSPQYCGLKGTKTCEVCAGVALSKFKTGLSIPLMEVSGGILNDSLKLMHNTALSTETVDLSSVIS